MDVDPGAGPVFKICGLTDPDQARVAEAAGASYVGTILVPASPRVVDAHQARVIADAVDIPLAVVVADLSPDAVARAAEVAGAAVIQLHGDEDESSIDALRAAGGWEVWKVVRPRSEEDLRVAASRFGPVVDLLLIDAWHPTRLGGTGSRADWSQVARLREYLRATGRLGLAGGLDPENVEDAIGTVGPELVDVSSGVESAPGRKDAALIDAFANAVRRARSPVGGRDVGGMRGEE